MKEGAGYIVPEVINPERRLCVQIMIPDDVWHIGNFWGALSALSKWNQYQKTGDTRGAEVAEVWKQVLLEAKLKFFEDDTCGGGAEPLPPEVIEKIIYIERWYDSDGDTEDHESECDCNMCKCINPVGYDAAAKTLYYLDANCNRVPIGDTAVSDDFQPVSDEATPDVPDVTSDFEDYQKNTEAMKCSKATALVNEMWNVVGIHEGFDEVVGLFATISFIAAAIATWAGAAGAAAVGASATSIGVSFADLITAIGLDQLKIKLQAITDNEEIKAELICDLVDRMTIRSSLSEIVSLTVKKTSIYDEDIKIAIERFAELVPDSDEAVILLKAFPAKSWKEVVTPKIAGTACGCEDYTPNPPPVVPPTEPAEGEFGLYAGEIVGNITTSMSPTASRAASNPRGVKVSELVLQGTRVDVGTDIQYQCFIMWEASLMITDITFEAIWKYTGDPSDASWVTVMDEQWFYSGAAGDNWAHLPGGIGNQNHNDSASPAMFNGQWNTLKVPWNNTVPTVDARFLGLSFIMNLREENSNGNNATWELRIQNFKIFADGGNYRAQVVPMQFVPKTI